MNYTQGLLDFIGKGTMAITAVSAGIDMLNSDGFEELKMSDNWMVAPGGKYYVRPYASTLIAFTIGTTSYVQRGFRIISSHTDSPGFRVKANPELVSGGYLKLNVDVYGGPMLYSWLDRPLSLAGQVVLKSDDIFEPKVVEVDFQEPIMTIPSLAIHFERKTNESFSLERQRDLMPLVQMIGDKFQKQGFLQKILADQIGCDAADILDYELFVYNTEAGQVIGLEKDLIQAPRIDNLGMVYGSVEALLKSDHEDGINMIACFDNEEIGSNTKQGGDSMILHQIIERIGIALKKTPEQLYRMYDSSFMVSADGAHASHPNAVHKNDITNEVILNRGLVIKASINQKYTTDAVSSGVMQQMCEKAEIPFQQFYIRTGLPGGATLGTLANKYLPIRSVDMGLPMLAMHSAKELIGVKDMEDCVKMFTVFFNA